MGRGFSTSTVAYHGHLPSTLPQKRGLGTIKRSSLSRKGPRWVVFQRAPRARGRDRFASKKKGFEITGPAHLQWRAGIYILKEGREMR